MESGFMDATSVARIFVGNRSFRLRISLIALVEAADEAEAAEQEDFDGGSDESTTTGGGRPGTCSEHSFTSAATRGSEASTVSIDNGWRPPSWCCTCPECIEEASRFTSQGPR